MIISRDHCRTLTIASALVATLAAGCALPVPFGASQHEGMLQALTQHEFSTPESPPPELVREPSPYPTAVAAAKVPTAAPLQANDPTPIPLNRKQLVGRIPEQMARPGQPTAQASQEARTETQPPFNPLSQQQVNQQPYADDFPAPPKPTGPQPITLDVAPANPPPGISVSSLLTYAEKSWPSGPALATGQPAVTDPINLKPQLPQFTLPSQVSAAAANPPLTFNPPSSDTPAPPATTSPVESAEVLLPKLIASLQKEIRERKDRKEEAASLEQKLRLLQLVADDTDDAVNQIEQLPPAEREAFKQMMFALTTWLSPDDAKRSSLRNAKILRSLDEVNHRLSAVSKLDLKNLMFCEKVESFGWYTEFPRAEFTPKQQVILYVEVQNFAAEEKTTSAFETELQGSYQIYDAGGNIIDERQLPLDREVCRNFRRDYFLAYRIYLPAELTAGRYRLELTVEDLKAKKDFKGRKQGEAMIEFAIK